MERRFEIRFRELMEQAKVKPEVVAGLLARLEVFLEPFVRHLRMADQQKKARQYVTGLVSNLDSKNVESIAYLYDQDRQGLQKFIGQFTWDHQPWQQELARQVGNALGNADGVLVFDPSAFAKKGTKSVGVKRQWCGRLGKIENSQVGVYLAYASQREHALVDFRLYVPKEWAGDKTRRHEARVPKSIRFRTRHELALEMLEANGSLLPHDWITGDDEMGRPTWFRQALRERGEQYLLAVPSNTLMRELQASAPPSSGRRGRRRQPPFVPVENWRAALSEEVWSEVEVRAGEKGPVIVEAVACRVQTKIKGGRVGPEETLVVFRERQADGAYKHDYMLSWASIETPLAEFARVFKAEHRIEECLQRAKSEAGLSDYEVRTWHGWHHHQMLSLLAVWFLTQEAERGKKKDRRAHRSSSAIGHCHGDRARDRQHRIGVHMPHDDAPPATRRTGTVLPLETT